jgi:hypothetical protein
LIRPEPRRAATADFPRRSAGVSGRDALQIILAAAVKTLSNYSIHLFQTTVDDKFAACEVD